MTYSAEVLADSPLAYYRLGEASGTTLVDASGSAHDGAYAGTVSRVSGLLSGDADTAVSFDGTTTRASVPDAAWMRPPLVTIEAVIQPNATGVSAGNHTIAGRFGSAGLSTLLRLESGKLVAYIAPQNAGTRQVNGGTTLVAGQSYHVAMTYDGVAIRVYVNGSLDARTDWASVGVSGNPGIPFTIGSNSNTTPSEFFAGVMDEVAYYDKALSPQRLAARVLSAGITRAAADRVSRASVEALVLPFPDRQVSRFGLDALIAPNPDRRVSRSQLEVLIAPGPTASSAVLPDSPLLYWKLDETSGTTAADSSGNGRAGGHENGTLVGQPSLLNDGGGGFSASYDGVNDDTAIVQAAWMNVSAFTVEARIKIAAGGLNPSDARIIMGRDANGGQRVFNLNHNNANKLAVSAIIDGVQRICVGATTLVAGTIYTVAATYDGTTLRVYLNGVLDGSLSVSGVLATSGAAPFVVGNMNLTAGSAAYNFLGGIDEVSWYGTALSSSKLANHHAVYTGSLPQTVPGGTTTESDSARPGSASTAQIVTGGTAREYDTARPGRVIPGRTAVIGGRSAESDAVNAGSIQARTTVSGGTASESDVARAGSSPVTIRGGQVLESDVATPGRLHTSDDSLFGHQVAEINVVIAGRVRIGRVALIGRQATETQESVAGTLVQGPAPTHRWSLYDPSRDESYEFPHNPNKMTTPHSPRNFHIIATAPSGILTGGSRQGLGRVVELAREPFEWTFSGRIKTQEQYEEFLRWSNKVNRLQLTDHLGRIWAIRILAFNPNELIPTPRIPWRYEYDLKALNYGLVT